MICHMASRPRHPGIHGVTLKVTAEEPEAGRDIQFADDMALAEFAAVQADLGDAVHHQHRRRGQLGIARAEIAALARFEQVVFAVRRLRNVKVAGVGHVTSHVTSGDVRRLAVRRQAVVSWPLLRRRGLAGATLRS